MELVKSVFPTRRTIQTNLMVALIIIAIVPVTLATLYYYRQTSTFIRQNVINYDKELLQQTARQLETILLDMEIIQNQVTAYLNASQSRSYFDAQSPAEKVAISTNTESFLRDIRRSLPPNVDIYVHVSDGSFFTTNSFADRTLLRSKEWLRAYEQGSETGPRVFAARADYFHYGESAAAPQTISFVKEIAAYSRADMSAIIQIDLDYSEVSSIFEGVDFGEDVLVYLRDANGNVIYSSAAPDVGGASAAADNAPPLQANAFAYSNPLKNSDWEVGISIPEEHLQVQLGSALRNWLYIIFIAAAASIVASYLLSKGITNPLHRLIKSMERTGEGEFSTVKSDSNEVELIALSDTYNRMVNQIAALMKHVTEKETEKTKAQLLALEAQINPHFLYNTLETLRSIALQHHLQSVSDMAKSLADMFRYSIDRKKEYVTLDEELQHVRNYMSIQQQRYGDHIRIDYLVDEEILSYKTIKMLLQPLVENTVVHGLELKPGNGRIMISAYLQDNNIYVSVVDDGLGMTPEVVGQLNQLFQPDGAEVGAEIESRFGLGLRNVDRRIKYHYGRKYGLWICSTPNIETVVRVCIPANR